MAVAPGGISAPVSINLTEGLSPGNVIKAVICTDVDMAINIRDKQNNMLLHAVARVSTKDFILNSRINGVWGTEIYVTPVPTEKGKKFAATIVYEQAGYRIFINEFEVKFFNHRWHTPAVLAEADRGVVYHMMYSSSTIIVPK